MLHRVIYKILLYLNHIQCCFVIVIAKCLGELSFLDKGKYTAKYSVGSGSPDAKYFFTSIEVNVTLKWYICPVQLLMTLS